MSGLPRLVRTILCRMHYKVYSERHCFYKCFTYQHQLINEFDQACRDSERQHVSHDCLAVRITIGVTSNVQTRSVPLQLHVDRHVFKYYLGTAVALNGYSNLSWSFRLMIIVR